jgi:eukaryotic-like serine/threonine-protein kinase
VVSTTYQDSRTALFAEELLRTRQYLTVMSAMFVVVALVLPIFEGDRFYRGVFTVGLVATFLSYLGFLWYIRDERNYTPVRALLPVYVGLLGGFTAGLYYGMFSPASMVFTLGIYFYSLSSSTSASLSVYLLSAFLQALGMLLIAFNVMPDRGLLRVTDVPLLERLGILVLVQIVFAMTYLFGRRSRLATATAMSRFENALRQVGQREALLQEANQELERARVVEGNRGRWSGERLGPWLLSRVIGRGGVGDVYEAYHEQRDLRAAVKLLNPEMEEQPQQLQRLLREADLISKLESPNVVRIYEFSPGTEGQPAYLAMELLKGEDLGRYLRRVRQLKPAEVLAMVTQVANVLEKARGHGVVHRDLKPQNVFRTEDPQLGPLWKVLDFGISKVGESSQTLSTGMGHVMGTPGYMAPEQATGGSVDHRADVFSLGVIAYRTLTGVPAFAGGDLARTIYDVAHVQPRAPSSNADLSEDVEFVLALALAKSPQERWETARELAEALAQALEGRLDPRLRERARTHLQRQPWGLPVAAPGGG